MATLEKQKPARLWRRGKRGVYRVMRRGMRQSLVLIGSLAIGTAAHPAPTGLNTIPTADLVPSHQYTFTLQNGNSALSGDAGPTLLHQPRPLFQWQFGMNPHLEGGVDAVPADSPGDYRPQFNLKWKPMDESYRHPALGVGIAQVGSGFHASPSYYFVATRTLNYSQMQYQKFRAHHRNIKQRGKRIHAGVIRTPAGTFALVGTDLEQSDHFVFYADWISGSPNAVSAGGVYIMNPNNSITAAMLYGNHEHRLNGLLINYSRTLKW